MSEEEASFVGSPGWAEVTDFCGVCHEAIAESYRQSVMDAELANGEQVAVCTTCHMRKGHEIVPAVSREIPTEEACGEWHSPQRAVVVLLALASVGTARLRTNLVSRRSGT